ncbi:SpoIIE family protein phosphatase [Lysobacter niastensis]|uniref:SpoIIE family protein phosphatase n=1 Tax=Lysobacter niastensis TaxID=380629 RepID=A0ABS0B8N2_9GAMM|nr:SpoIIE family protein phosphatase [Lysobacter niastensis]MBF6025340.1 SpoIIE family protein phosphatase [Lysobacter niastensis]
MATRLEALPLGPVDRVRKRDSLRTRIALWSGMVGVLLVCLMVGGVAWYLRQQVDRDARLDTMANAQQAAEQLDATMLAVTVSTDGLSDLAAHSGLDPAALTSTLRSLVKATPGCAGGLLALEPRVAGGTPYAHYVHVDGRADRDFVAEDYDYRSKPWYERTLHSARGWWSEPYFSETAGNRWMVTYNKPLPQGAGMVSLDLPLTALTDSLQTVAYLPGWRASLVAPGGMIAFNPDVTVAREMTMERFVRLAGRSDLLPAVEAVRERRHLQLVHIDASSGEKRFSVVEPVGETGWTVVVSQSYRLIIARLNRLLMALGATGLLLAGLCMLLMRRLAGRIGKPVQQLAASATHLSEANYEAPVPHTLRRDEVGLLARAFDHARGSIKEQLRRIEQMGAARQKLESELSIARDIQLAMLPEPPVLRGNGRVLRAHAMLEPAKAVGGDFYTFFVRDGRRLWFAIGDVSDKGVPAALFMARAMTVLEVATSRGGSVEDALRTAATRLADGNDTCMFATVLCGRINVDDGELRLASAAHEPPVLLRADGSREFLAVEAAGPLGIDIEEHYPVWRGRLEPGDALVAYTDGITEAFDGGQQAFGTQRLMDALQPGSDPGALRQALVSAAHRFSGAAPQSDDITVLALCLATDTDGGE